MTLPGDWYWRRYHPEPKNKKEPAAPPPNQDTYVPNYTPAPIIEEEEEQEETLPPVKE